MFETLDALSPDPLLGLMRAHHLDPRPEKIDLGVGVYKNTEGETPVLNSVKSAEKFLWENEASKAYVGPFGHTGFTDRMGELVFGQGYSEKTPRFASIQTPGGCGALRLLAELCMACSPSATIWLSDPTWANHVPLLSACGAKLKTYRYYDADRSALDAAGMFEDLQAIEPGDVLLLHGCCHNPSGADLNRAQWRTVVDVCREKKAVPLFDLAYQGYGESLCEDAYGVQLASQWLPEVMLAVSCSKNFGLYRERVGAALVLSSSPKQSDAVRSHLAKITRGIYSMPPSHGASIVATVLSSTELRGLWEAELTEMRHRIVSMRQLIARQCRLRLGTRFDYITQEKGMFSFLGLGPQQVDQLAKDYGIYMAPSSRINVAGICPGNVGYFVDAVAAV